MRQYELRTNRSVNKELSRRCVTPGADRGDRKRRHGRKGTTERVPTCRDRATLPIEGIWTEKIRGCSDKEALRSYST
jgi:hypothetical protein